MSNISKPPLNAALRNVFRYMTVKLTQLHRWDISPREAVKVQDRIKNAVVIRELSLRSVRTVAGVDVSFKDGNSKAAIVIMEYPSLEPVETVSREMEVRFPYVPGLLTFREGPVLIECIHALTSSPDVFIFDGQGLAHPRGAGLACHIGVLLGKPSVGFAKSRLYGQFSEPGPGKGDYSYLTDTTGREIGAVLRTRTGTKPIFVSPGHLTDIPFCIELALACSPRYRIPEPTRAAHKAASLSARRM